MTTLDKGWNDLQVWLSGQGTLQTSPPEVAETIVACMRNAYYCGASYQQLAVVEVLHGSDISPALLQQIRDLPTSSEPRQ